MNNQRTKMFGQTYMPRFGPFHLSFSTLNHHEVNLKPDYIVFQDFGASVLSNKSFSNPNFVNKQNPHIFTPVTLDKQKIVNCIKPQSQLSNCNNKKSDENSVFYQQIPEKLSSQNSTQSNVNKSEMPEAILTELPAKIPSKKNRKKKNRKNTKCYKQDITPVDQIKLPKNEMTAKKSNCSAPKKLKKEPEIKMRSRGKSKKCKPWHKFSFNMEIMECNEANIPSPETPQIDMSPKEKFCVQIKSSPIEISQKCPKLLSETFSLSISPGTEFLKNLSSSNTSTSDVCSLSPSSPAIRRLRMPSECDSEDSFIVFCEDAKSCTSEDESTYDELTDSDDSDFDVDFQEKTDLNKGNAKKKVTFRNDSELCEVHPMVKWGYAYHTARKGPWEELARDRARFECRIKRTECEISDILDPKHRDKIYHERFEPMQ